MDKSVVSFIENALFTTLTNVNFDAEVHVELLRESQRIKEELRAYAGAPSQPTLHATYDLPQTKTEMLRDAPIAGIMYDKSLDPDIRSPASDRSLRTQRHQRLRASGERARLLQR